MTAYDDNIKTRYYDDYTRQRLSTRYNKDLLSESGQKPHKARKN